MGERRKFSLGQWRMRNLVETDRVQDILSAAGLRLPQNISNVCIDGGLLEFERALFDGVTESFYIDSVRISRRKAHMLEEMGIPVRALGRVSTNTTISRLTQKGKKI